MKTRNATASVSHLPPHLRRLKAHLAEQESRHELFKAMLARKRALIEIEARKPGADLEVMREVFAVLDSEAERQVRSAAYIERLRRRLAAGLAEAA